MNRLLVEIGRSQRVAIIYELKRSPGLAVKEIARRLKMSYMGIKQHCLDLERDGYLDTWRNPRPIGRPEMLYRLTRKAEDLFPTESNAMAMEVLASAGKLFGPTAPAKLLLLYFRSKGDAYAAKVKGESVAARAKWFARVRDREGCMAELVTGDELMIVERHTLIGDLLAAYPQAADLEREMVAKVLGAPVRREARGAGGMFECRFVVG